jgi:ribosomal protein S12 methylthiotransferase
MAGQVPARIKRKRRDLAMAAQHEVAVQIARSFVGRTIKVLIEKEASARELQRARVSSWEHGLNRILDLHTAALKGHFLVARGEADAPDIDGRVYVRGQVPIGAFVQVKIVGHTDYDLMAEPV